MPHACESYYLRALGRIVGDRKGPIPSAARAGRERDIDNAIGSHGDGIPAGICLGKVPTGCDAGDRQGRIAGVTERHRLGRARWTWPKDSPGHTDR